MIFVVKNDVSEELTKSDFAQDRMAGKNKYGHL